MTHSTKERLLDTGLALLLEQGYNHLGIDTLLKQAGVPKGSFYHHFRSKEAFALQVIEAYMAEVKEGLDACLGDDSLPPLARVRRFLELSKEKYRGEGYLGCLLGGLGQELSGVNERFRRKVEECFSEIARRFAACFELAKTRGELPADADSRELADLLINCWEGAALRSRLWRKPSPLDDVLDFYFGAVAGRGAPAPLVTPR
ncbi:MAG TPA: TetR family transcriptional regulator C-terminal domain-containing protein [Woeseiaceae bacterium]|nr:TetR family transcriptional regulator C-terminal domain-containing protein [Woeseiaceae bacterium]